MNKFNKIAVISLLALPSMIQTAALGSFLKWMFVGSHSALSGEDLIKKIDELTKGDGPYGFKKGDIDMTFKDFRKELRSDITDAELDLLVGFLTTNKVACVSVNLDKRSDWNTDADVYSYDFVSDKVFLRVNGFEKKNVDTVITYGFVKGEDQLPGQYSFFKDFHTKYSICQDRSYLYSSLFTSWNEPFIPILITSACVGGLVFGAMWYGFDPKSIAAKLFINSCRVAVPIAAGKITFHRLKYAYFQTLYLNDVNYDAKVTSDIKQNIKTLLKSKEEKIGYVKHVENMLLNACQKYDQKN